MYSFSLQLKDLFTSPLEKLREGLRGVNREADDLQDNLDDVGTRGSSSLGGLVSMAGKLFAAMATISTVKALFDMGVQAEQTKIKFEVLLGSAEKGKVLLDQLNSYANFTPYSNGGITKAAETMLGFGIAQDKIMPNMKMLGDVAMGNEDKLGSLSLVYAQIAATGRLTGGDLIQLINTGFNPLQVIADKTGMSMGSLKEKMEKGAISSVMVAEAFSIATSEGGRYYQMADKMANTAGGKWSTFLGGLQDKVKIVGEAFARSLSPVIDFGIKSLDYIIPFLKWIKDIVVWITNAKPLLIFLSGIILALGINFIITNAAAMAFAVILGILNGAIWLVTAATTAWNFVMSLNPISLVILAIAALIAIVVLLWNKFDWFRGGVIGVWEVLKGLGDMIKDYVINRINDLMKAIQGVGQAFQALKNGNFSEAFDIGKGVIGDLAGVDSKTKFLQSGKKLGENWTKGYAEGVGMGTPAGVKTAATVGKKKAGASVYKTDAFNPLLGGADGKDGKGGKGKKGMGGVKSKADGIISGGSKQTNINITIGKLQDHTIIQVDSVEKGLSNLGDKVQELLLRAVNSANQMQTT